MNKAELITAVAEAAELSKKDAEKAVAAVTGEITKALQNEWAEIPRPRRRLSSPLPRLLSSRLARRLRTL